MDSFVTTSSTWAVLGLFSTLFLMQSHCSKPGRQEASAVLRALEQVREAGKEEKGPLALALANTACSTTVVCAARDQCASVYQHFAKGIAAQMRVRDELDLLERTPPASAEKIGRLNDELARAQAEVDSAQTGLAECERAASLMRRTYGI